VVVPDVNVLVHAHRRDSPEHAPNRHWLERHASGDDPIGVPDFVLSGFIRVVTHPRVYSKPSSISDALRAAESLREAPSFVSIAAGARHWAIFTRLCERTPATGNLVPDAYLAALAIEAGARLVTSDGDFGRFPGLLWQHPAAAPR